MAEFIEKTDTLNEGREKLNAAIQDAEDAKTTAGQAVNTSNEAKQIAQTAENKADNVQEQFNQVVIEGDSSVEAAQARVDADGNTFTTLKERLDTKEAQFASQLADIEQQKADKSEVNNLANDKADLTYVDGKIGSINERIDNLDGLEFKGAFDTLNDLETMYPNGGTGLYIIHSDNHWYYWNPVTTKWTKGNELTTTPWSEFMTTDGEPWEVS